MEKALDILKLFQSDKYKFESGAPLWKPELDSKMKQAIAELKEAMIVLKELKTQLKAKNEEIKNLKAECECDQRNAAMSQKESVQYLNRIAELEEAMKSKTCDWCKQSWEPNNQTFHKYFCEYLKIPVHRGFYCNRYEPKDNA